MCTVTIDGINWYALADVAAEQLCSSLSKLQHYQWFFHAYPFPVNVLGALYLMMVDLNNHCLVSLSDSVTLMDGSPLGSYVHEISPARILE